MKSFFVFLLVAIQFTSGLALASAESPLFIKEVNSLADGIISPRADVASANYNTQYSEVVATQQQQIESIYKKIYGLDQIDSSDFKTKAAAVYLLEHEIALFLQDIPSSKISSFERRSLLYKGVQAYKTLRSSAEQIYDNTLRLIDIALPGPGGPQIRIKSKQRFATYLPNYRSDQPLEFSQKQAFYESKLSKFLSEGGSLNEIKILIDTQVLNDAPGLSTYEYVQLPNGEIRLTKGSAGHLILAEGKMVRAAGNIAIVRDANSKISLLVVSNSSGTFKPDIYSAEQTARKIARLLKVPSERVVVTRGQPFGLQNLEILLKAEYHLKSEIESKLQSLKQQVSRGQQTFSALRCEKIFKGSR